MSKIMIWVGQFNSEADFEKYMDQTEFYNGGLSMMKTIRNFVASSVRSLV